MKDLLAGAGLASCGVYALLALFFVLMAMRRRSEAREYLLFASSCLAIAGFSTCEALQEHNVDAVAAANWGRRGVYCATIGGAFLLHVALVYAEIEPRIRRWIVPSAYVAAGAISLMVLRGWILGGRIVERYLSVGAVGYYEHSWTPGPAAMAFQLYVVLCAFLVVGAIVKAWRDGKSEAMLALFGAMVLAVCVVNDVLVMSDVTRGLFISKHGFSAFAFGLSFTLLARHARRSEELSLRSAELRKRAKQLGRAYEELRAAQEELVRREQLAVVGELAAVVSHEVRNPLAIIGNAVAGLRRAETNAADRATLLEILEEETARLNRLVGDLLRYARPLVVERQPLDLDALVGRACELAKNAPSVRLEREGHDGPLPSVYGDRDLLRQVLDNLVQNACQAMPQGGTLTVRIVAAEEEGHAGVAVEIADTGEGMDTQVRSRARTPFFTTRPAGTGLGLAICDRIVTAHGGILAIKSRALEGTVVSVFLPSDRRSDVPPLMRNSSPPSHGSIDLDSIVLETKGRRRALE